MNFVFLIFKKLATFWKNVIVLGQQISSHSHGLTLAERGKHIHQLTPSFLCVNFLPQAKDRQVRLIGYSKSPIGMNLSVSSVYTCDFWRNYKFRMYSASRPMSAGIGSSLPSCQGQASVDIGWMDILLFYYYYYLCPNLSHCVSHTEPEGMQFHSPVLSLLHGLKDNKMLFD